MIFFFWMPLAATWFMMSVEGPFLAAIIARLPDPKYNLAAYGVSFSIAIFVEAPVIMLMSASTALVKDRDSFIKLRNFTYALNAVVTLIMVLFVIPPVFDYVAQEMLNLPEPVARLAHKACIIFIPWAGAIGYRRFYQGILIRSNLTRRVAYGTIIRLTAMASTGLFCCLFTKTQGAVVGAVALSSAVCVEAVASKFMVRASVGHLLSEERQHSEAESLTYGMTARFYLPLALTSILGLGVSPLVTFSMGHSRMAIESLAVLPVINALVFLFRSLGFSFQEVGIALFGERDQGYRPLRHFAILLGLAVSLGLSLVAFTPLSSVWFQGVSGLSAALAAFALWPTRIVAVMPGLEVLLSFQRALLVNHRKTGPITLAACIEVAGIGIFLFLSIRVFGMVGAIAAALSITLGRVLANVYMTFPYLKTLPKTPTNGSLEPWPPGSSVP